MADGSKGWCWKCRTFQSVANPVCTECGATRPVRKSEPWTFQGVLFLTVFVGIIAGIGYGGWRMVAWITAPREAPTSLSAEVRFSGSQIQIENNDTYAWTLCKVTLNSGIVRGSWSQEMGQIPAGETVSGGLMAFTRGRGERFNPLTHAVEDVLIDCDTPEGRRYWTGRAR